MSGSDNDPVTSAAGTVISALQPLTTDERQRVVDAVSALFGLLTSRRGAGISDSAESRDEPDRFADTGAPKGKTGEGKRQSIVEFLNTKNPATNSQRLACFAYYREHVEKMGQNFAKADLKPYFASAKLPKPGNYDRDFREAVGTSWIHEDGANSYLTQAGEAAVSTGFGGKGRPRGTSASRKKRASAAKSS
jgi:hypothetical protein